MRYTTMPAMNGKGTIILDPDNTKIGTLVCPNHEREAEQIVAWLNGMTAANDNAEIEAHYRDIGENGAA